MAINRHTGWRGQQDLLALLTRIANHKSAQHATLVEGELGGDRVVELSGQRWRVWRDENGEEQATPIADDE